MKNVIQVDFRKKEVVYKKDWIYFIKNISITLILLFILSTWLYACVYFLKGLRG